MTAVRITQMVHTDWGLRGLASKSTDGAQVRRQAGRALATQTPDIPPLARSALSRQTPKVGAVCGNSARMVLCGGRAVMRVSTAIECRFTPEQSAIPSLP